MTRMLTEGLIEERGSGRGRRYHLSAAVYRALDSRAAYVRVRSFEPIQQEQMVLNCVRAHGSIARAEAAGLCSMSPVQASNLLRRLAREGKLRMEGTKRGSRYVLP
jgi:ATP-dependent DNA helicase RecG